MISRSAWFRPRGDALEEMAPLLPHLAEQALTGGRWRNDEAPAVAFVGLALDQASRLQPTDGAADQTAAPIQSVTRLEDRTSHPRDTTG